jgi:hypothetical protein
LKGLFQSDKKIEWVIGKTPKKNKPLGSTSPYAWVIEPTYGCNLRCGHCSHALQIKKKFLFMSEKTWVDTWTLLNKVSPTVRVDLCLSGEPTLHPHLVAFIRVARKISLYSQIQITTNGTMLLKGKIHYKELLDAGANIVYTDMYGPHEKFISLAEDSGYPYYEYYGLNRPANAPSPWQYHGPDLKLIVLQEQPENWPKSRFKAGLLGTWYNNLDWEAAKKFGLSPIVKPLTRRCNQPFIYVPINYKGDYLLCCQDNCHESENLFGNVKDGEEGFLKYWYGEPIQKFRVNLRNKDRAKNEFCQRCGITFSRCDYLHWSDQDVSKYYDGKWKRLPKLKKETRQCKKNY